MARNNKYNDTSARRTTNVRFTPLPDHILQKFLDDGDLKEGYVAGWASTDKIDFGGDKVLPGAFDESIAKKGLTGPKGIKLLLQHNPNKPAGQIVKLEQRPAGLWIEAQLNLDISYVKDYYEAAKMNGGMSFSIGYRLVEGGYRFVEAGQDSYWELSKLDLHEVSVVTFPMNDDAQMVFIKSMEDGSPFADLDEAKEALVEVGFVKDMGDADAFIKWVKTVDRPQSPTTSKKMAELSAALSALKATLQTERDTGDNNDA